MPCISAYGAIVLNDPILEKLALKGGKLTRPTRDDIGKLNRLVYIVAFSPSGKTIATASGDKTAKLWDVLTGKELLTLQAPDELTGVSFSPDGSQLAVASRDGTSRIYLLKIEDLVALARQRVTRSLTTEECQQFLHVATCPAEP